MRIVYVVLALSITLLIFSVNVALGRVFEYGHTTASWEYDAMLYDKGVIKPPGFLPKRLEEPQPKPELRE